MDEHYFCGQSIQRMGLARWPGVNPDLPWHVDLSGYVGTLTRGELLGAFSQAWQWWSDAAEIAPRMVDSANDAVVRIHFARIDGPNGVLAWSELADNSRRPKTQRYDNSEKWSIEWFLQAVIAHELGHVLGLEHDTQSSGALMAPFIQQNVPKPTERDVKRLLNLGYSKRTTTPTPQPLPPANIIRFAKQVPAGVHGDISLGSAFGPGDYMFFLVGDGAPPPVP